MQAQRGEAQRHIARANRLATDDAVALDDADNRAGQIVLARSVESRHRGGFAANQRATRLAAALRDTAHDGDRLIAIHRAKRQIIQEEERARATDENIINTVSDEVFANGLVAVEGEGDLELGADAVN